MLQNNVLRLFVSALAVAAVSADKPADPGKKTTETTTTDASLYASGFDGPDKCLLDDVIPKEMPEWLPAGKRCCEGEYWAGVAGCETSSCPNNFGAKNLLCHNYGTPQFYSVRRPDKPAGSAICPYMEMDQAICDTSYYDHLNGVKCRENVGDKSDEVHCLGKVKCMSSGVVFPPTKGGKPTISYGVDAEDRVGHDNACPSGAQPGRTCFYMGASDNWKVCDNEGFDPDTYDEDVEAAEDTKGKKEIDDWVEERGKNIAEATCPADMKLTIDGFVSDRCCKGIYDGGNKVASCDTSSCQENFDMKDILCFTFGAPNFSSVSNPTKVAGSNNCPYLQMDKATCDTSFYDEMNGVSCKDMEGSGANGNGANNALKCLGKVKCGDGGACPSGAMEGADCFYTGDSDNWKVCGPKDDDTTSRTIVPPSKGSGSGDPHFKTWTGDKYDYHGECDLVLVNNPTFMDGLGLRVHIRTTRVKYFSYIEKVAVQIGEDVLEFDNDVENFYINGELAETNAKHHKTMLGGFIVRRDPKALSIRLHDEGRHDRYAAKIDLHTRKNGFPAVIVDGGHTEVFKGSLGLLGDWETGYRLARDGETVVHDATEFALEWQVRDTEPLLFKDARFPQYPTTCTPPAEMVQRLGQSSFQKEAEEACAHWKEDIEDCIFDVIATRDVLVAEEGHIVHLS